MTTKLKRKKINQNLQTIPKFVPSEQESFFIEFKNSEKKR